MATQEATLGEALVRYARELEQWQEYVKLLEQHISHVLANQQTTYHSITSREKKYTSFEEKARRKSYDDVYGSILDKAGIRVITYLQSECDEVQRVIEPEFELVREHCIFRPAELNVDQMGYRSTHLVCIPSKELLRIPCWMPYEGWPFEVQIRSLLEHAWAELSHPRAYKFHGGSLPRDLHRRFYIVAGALELCDTEFDAIAASVQLYEQEVIDSTDAEKSGIDLNAASISAFLAARWSDLSIETMPESSWKILIRELHDFGAVTLADLDAMIPDDYGLILAKHEHSTNALGALRLVMLVADHDRYFSDVWHQDWAGIERDESSAILGHYGLDADGLDNEHRMMELHRKALQGGDLQLPSDQNMNDD